RHTRFDCDWSSDVCSSDLRGQQVPDTLAEGFAPQSEQLAEKRQVLFRRQLPVQRQLLGHDADGPPKVAVGWLDLLPQDADFARRSEERRVGKECRCRGWAE